MIFHARLTLGLLAGLTLFAVPARAFDETNREIARTYANHYLQLKDFKSAQALLQEHLEDDAEDAVAWNLLGMVRYEAADYPGAAGAYEKAIPQAESGPDRTIYRYHLAEALDRQGKKEEAQAALKLCLAEPTATLTYGPDGTFPRLDFLAPPSLHLGLTFLSGYDSNVLLLPDSVLAFTARSQTASPSSTLSTDLNYHKPLADRRSLDAHGLASTTFQYAQAARVFSNFYASGDAAFGWASTMLDGRARHELGDGVDLSLVNFDGLKFFNWTNGLFYRLRLPWSRTRTTTFEFPFRYQGFAVPDGAGVESDRSGFGFKPKLTHAFELGVYSLSAGLEYEQHDANAPEFRLKAISVPLTVSRAIPWRLTAILGLGYTRSSFPDSGNRRLDSTYKVSGTVSRELGPRLLGTLSLNLLWNHSNSDAAAFSRYALVAGVNYGLF